METDRKWGLRWRQTKKEEKVGDRQKMKKRWRLTNEMGKLELTLLPLILELVWIVMVEPKRKWYQTKTLIPRFTSSTLNTKTLNPSALQRQSHEEITIQYSNWATSKMLPEHGCVLIKWRTATRGASGVETCVKAISLVTPKWSLIYS